MRKTKKRPKSFALGLSLLYLFSGSFLISCNKEEYLKIEQGGNKPNDNQTMTTTKRTNGMSLNALGVKVLKFVKNAMEMGWMHMTKSVTIVMDLPFTHIATVQE